jgi:hypothetical protein
VLVGDVLRQIASMPSELLSEAQLKVFFSR